MHRRGTIALLLTALMAALLCGCGRMASFPEQGASDPGVPTQDAIEREDLKIVIASDLHYLAPELTDRGAYFWRVMENGDGKVTEYCEEILDAFVQDLLADPPAAVVLTGDVSFNGALESHRALAAKLEQLEAAGIAVLILPGNHDVFRSSSAAFFGDGYELRETATSESFREVYTAYGYDEALSRDESSLSFVARLDSHTRAMLLDADTLHDFCSLSPDTLAWVDAQLEDAERAGERTLVFCHQNLYQHSMFRAGYVLDCADALHDLLEKHHVPLFFSGHMHIQHILTQGGVTEICTSPLTMGECRYGILRVSGETLRYETRPVDVAAWAASQGVENEDLLQFHDYALESMARRTRSEAEGYLSGRLPEGEEQKTMVDYAVALNLAYFAGDLTDIPALDPEGALLKGWEESGTMFGFYFASIREEIGMDYCHWEGNW